MTATPHPISSPMPRLAKLGAVLASVSALGLAGCAGMDPQTRNTTIGAAAGAVAGQVITGNTTGAAVGAVVGGVIGHETEKKK